MKYSLEQALAYLQEHYLALYYADERDGGISPVDIWSSRHVKVPIGIRRTVFLHRYEILDMMRSGAAAVCPNRAYHRQYWTYNRREKRVNCRLCVRLEAEMRHYPAVDYSTKRANRAS